MPLFIHVSGDRLMINDSTGLTGATGKNAPPRKPKITIGKFRKFWITVKLLIASPKNNPKGKYLCGYQKGKWDKLPALYQQMLDYANKNNLHLTGYAYEVGLNDFVISDEADYITKIMIKIKETS